MLILLEGITEQLTILTQQFDFNDVIYHVQPCNVDNRLRNVVFKTIH